MLQCPPARSSQHAPVAPSAASLLRPATDWRCTHHASGLMKASSDRAVWPARAQLRTEGKLNAGTEERKA